MGDLPNGETSSPPREERGSTSSAVLSVEEEEGGISNAPSPNNGAAATKVEEKAMKPEYEQTPNDGGAGFQYEKKMAALVALRLCQQAGEFRIAINLKRAQPFDDIVFSAQVDGKSTMWFVQLKHNNKVPTKPLSQEHLKNNGDFHLVKYFKSYKTIKDIGNILGEKCDNAKFVLFTNKPLEQTIKDANFITPPISYLTTGSEELTLQFNVSGNENLFKTMKNDNQISPFVRDLYLCTNQVSLSELDGIIQSEVATVFSQLRLTHDDLGHVTDQFNKFVDEWSGTGRYLTKQMTQDFLNRATMKISYFKKPLWFSRLYFLIYLALKLVQR